MIRRTCLVAAILFSTHSVLDAEPTLQKLIATGDPAPGFGPGVTIRQIQNYAPTIASDGQVAVAGWTEGDGITSHNDFAIWAGRPGDMRLVAREGRNVHDTPETLPDGAVARCTSGGILLVMGNKRVWCGRPHKLGLVVREGDPLPVSRKDKMRGEYHCQAAGAHLLVRFGSGLAYVQDVRSRPPEVRACIRSDDSVDRGKFRLGRLGTTLLAQSGTVFVITTSGSGGPKNILNTGSLVAFRKGAAELLLAPGQPAPGMGEGVKFRQVRENSMTATPDGVLAFVADTDDTLAAPWGIWFALPNGRLALALKANAALENSSVKISHVSGDRPLAVNANGEIAAIVRLSDGHEALVIIDEGGARCVVRSDDNAPGIRGSFKAFHNCVFDQYGRLFFTADPGPAWDRRTGIWAAVDDELLPIVLTGDDVRLSTNQIREVSNILFQCGSAGSVPGSGLTEDGKAAVLVEFAGGGAGVFVAESPEVNTARGPSSQQPSP